MANRKHVTLLDSGKWNAWGEKSPRVRPDLSGADLALSNLMGADLSKANLQGADLGEGWSRHLELSAYRPGHRSPAIIWRVDNVSETNETSQCCRSLRPTHLRRSNARYSVLNLLWATADFSSCGCCNAVSFIPCVCRGCRVA